MNTDTNTQNSCAPQMFAPGVLNGGRRALGAGLVGSALLLLAARHIARDEATRVERAHTAGER